MSADVSKKQAVVLEADRAGLAEITGSIMRPHPNERHIMNTVTVAQDIVFKILFPRKKNVKPVRQYNFDPLMKSIIK
jgi:hypothetical protein